MTPCFPIFKEKLEKPLFLPLLALILGISHMSNLSVCFTHQFYMVFDKKIILNVLKKKRQEIDRQMFAVYDDMIFI
jgi:hypothetical protein